MKDKKRVNLNENDQVFKDCLMSKLKESNDEMRSLKSKFMALGWYFMMKYFIFLLRVPMTNQPWGVSHMYTSVVSVVPGKRDPYVFDLANKDSHGIQVRSLVYFVPGSARLGNGVAVITHGNKMQLGLMADTSYWTEDKDSHQRFVETFEKFFEKAVKLL